MLGYIIGGGLIYATSRSKSDGPIPEMCRTIVSTVESGCRTLNGCAKAVEKTFADIADDFAEQNASTKKKQ